MTFATATKFLLEKAEQIKDRAYVPYSSDQRAAALLLADGSVIGGVRVENASFSLTLSAINNAFSTAAALGKTDILAVGLCYDATPADVATLLRHPYGPFHQFNSQVFVRLGIESLPEGTDFIDPIQPPMSDRSSGSAILAARAVSSRAYITESRFPVGCLIELSDGRQAIGVNVEHPDWTQIICAERNAMGTIVSSGLSGIEKVFLSCPADDRASPCGACRQVLVELAPEATVLMDRGSEDADQARVDELLPGYFSGKALRRTS